MVLSMCTPRLGFFVEGKLIAHFLEMRLSRNESQRSSAKSQILLLWSQSANLRSATRHAVCGTVYWTTVSWILLRAHADRAESSPTRVLLVREAHGSVRSVAEWFVPRLPAPAKRHPIANFVG